MIKKNLYVIFTIFITGTCINAQFTFQDAFPSLTFSSPIFLTHSDDGTNRIFVVEQDGIIKVFPNTQTASNAKIFLDITDRVAFGDEMGLLGLAFHPDYETNGYFYVNYTADSPRRTIITRFQVTSNPDSADKNSEFQILTFSQPYSNHKGGWVGFRPNDGYLYIASGDGGSDGDAQSLNTMLGKILRVDIDGGTPYVIPPSNPFYDSTDTLIKKEIYAWGFRNPWRCSFDAITNRFWAGDVGQGEWEEIDIIENGKNFGWSCYEGNHPYNTSGCNYPEYTYPIWEYGHNPECSIIGGYVYRGPNVPELQGRYIYTDYCSNKLWSLEYDGITPPTNQYLLNTTSSPTSFGVDQQQELYITSSNGKIYSFTPTINPTTFPLTVTVTNGWNMVATPGLHPVDQNITTWWPGKDPSASVFKFSGTYVPITTVTPGLGYWMKNNGAQTYNTGDEWPTGGINIVPNDPITVTSGWNMIGVYHYNVPKAGITTTGGSLTGSIFKYSSGYVSVDTLKPGYGYWAKMTAAGTIILPSSTFQGVAKQVETDTKDWGRIVITDNSGKIYTLYCVKGLVDLNNYELPPTPNAEMFDVRYGSNRYAEDLSTGNQSIEMQGMEYPIKVRVENMGIRIKDASGNGLNERLKAGEEVTISNSAISKLMVSGDVIPTTYSLEQNYPNPFNPSTKISWQSPIGSWHTLKVYDVLGNEVATLVNEYRSAGSYEIEFSAAGGPESSIKHFASGIYFYQLKTDKFVAVKKMMLLK